MRNSSSFDLVKVLDLTRRFAFAGLLSVQSVGERCIRSVSFIMRSSGHRGEASVFSPDFVANFSKFLSSFQ